MQDIKNLRAESRYVLSVSLGRPSLNFDQDFIHQISTTELRLPNATSVELFSPRNRSDISEEFEGIFAPTIIFPVSDMKLSLLVRSRLASAGEDPPPYRFSMSRWEGFSIPRSSESTSIVSLAPDMLLLIFHFLDPNLEPAVNVCRGWRTLINNDRQSSYCKITAFLKLADEAYQCGTVAWSSDSASGECRGSDRELFNALRHELVDLEQAYSNFSLPSASCVVASAPPSTFHRPTPFQIDQERLNQAIQACRKDSRGGAALGKVCELGQFPVIHDWLKEQEDYLWWADPGTMALVARKVRLLNVDRKMFDLSILYCRQALELYLDYPNDDLTSGCMAALMKIEKRVGRILVLLGEYDDAINKYKTIQCVLTEGEHLPTCVRYAVFTAILSHIRSLEARDRAITSQVYRIMIELMSSRGVPGSLAMEI